MCFLPHLVRALVTMADERIIPLARLCRRRRNHRGGQAIGVGAGLIRRLAADSYHGTNWRDLSPLLVRHIMDCANGRRRRWCEDLRLAWYGAGGRNWRRAGGWCDGRCGRGRRERGAEGAGADELRPMNANSATTARQVYRISDRAGCCCEAAVNGAICWHSALVEIITVAASDQAEPWSGAQRDAEAAMDELYA
jgi:hypothetical protein